MQNLLHLPVRRLLIDNAAVDEYLAQIQSPSIDPLGLFSVHHLFLNIHLRTDQGLMPLVGSRALDASALTDIYLEEAIPGPALL